VIVAGLNNSCTIATMLGALGGLYGAAVKPATPGH